MTWLEILSPIVGLLVNVLIQTTSFQYIRGLGLFKSIALGFTAGFLTVFILEFYRYFDLPAMESEFFYILCVNLITYILLGYCYWAYINLGETSLRIRILREMYETQKALPIEKLFSIYNPDNMFEIRMSRLLKYNQIVCKNDRYFIGKSILLLIAKAIVIIKLMIIGKKSEFD